MFNGAIYPLQYDLLNDLDPVVLLPSNPMVVVSKTTVPAKSLQDLIGWLKANEDKHCRPAGAGSGSHVAAVYFRTSPRSASRWCRIAARARR